ncbi:MAG: DUF1553 domain-containing protein [Planctomycetota bacterium]
MTTVLLSMLPAVLVGSDQVDFAADVRPILSDRCFHCHGPGNAEPAGALRLDLADSAVDELGFGAIVPGDPDASELIRRVTHANPERRMPPESSHLSLTADEVDLLRRWIEDGAAYDEHWSFTRPERSPAPEIHDESWARDDIDRFVLARLEAAEITPSPEADPATILRRVSLDLTGLPPSLDELERFLGDESPDRYERAVDRLLASTTHAERMTAHWLDVARYADTFGYQADVDMNVWPWRDWVLGAFESNLPYDDFVVQQIAGDLLPNATKETCLATAFQRLHRQTNEGGSVEEELRVEYVCDRVETTAAAFLGLTMGCARCHDHKFDPVTQRDFFALSAFFDGIDESGLYSHFTDAVPTPALDLATEEQASRLAELQAKVADAVVAPPSEGGMATFATDFAEAVTERTDDGKERVTFAATGGTSIETSTCVAVGEPEVVREDELTYVRLDGENALIFPGTGDFRRSDPFSIGLSLRLPEPYERAVVVHRSKAWTDSGSRGYQLLIEDGRPTVALVHFWPGDAIAIRGVDPLPVDAWVDVAFTYDGSSRADGLRLYVDGAPVETVVVRDRLTRTIRGGGIEHLTIGSRFRDRGFTDGCVRSFAVFDRELATTEVARLAASGPTSIAEERSPNPAQEALRTARAERDALLDEIRQIMTMREGPGLPGTERTAYLLGRGAYSERGEPVAPATPAFLPTLIDGAPATRLDLARWLVHPDHPLTARVHVDRLWRIAFGRGLVPTPEDFGSQCPPPVHGELLDALSRDLVESGWDSRALLRRMVLSSAYRQSSAGTAESIGRDPDGALISRALRVRLEAETIRDSVLAASGLLVRDRGGPPVAPYQPPGLWQEKSGKVYRPDRGDDLRRRSLYTFWRRTSPPPTMSLFDAPTREVCVVSRPSTTTPLQALALWNDPQFVEASVAFARRAVERTGGDASRVEFMTLALASRAPIEAESRSMVELLGVQREAYIEDVEAARALASYDLERIAHPADEGAQAPLDIDDSTCVEIAATAIVASALLGLDDVVTRR